MYCQFCGKSIYEDAVICTNCGRQVSGIVTGKIENSEPKKWKSYGLLIVLSILFPFIGIILGIVGLIQGRSGSGTLLIIGLAAWLFFIILFI